MKTKKQIIEEYREKCCGSSDKLIQRGNVIISYDDRYLEYVGVAYYDKVERIVYDVVFFQEHQVYDSLGENFFKVSDTTKYKRVSDYIENYIY